MGNGRDKSRHNMLREGDNHWKPACFAMFSTVREEIINVTTRADTGYFNMLWRETCEEQLFSIRLPQVEA